jgi:hypothetical protein
MQVRIEKPIAFMTTIRIATDLEKQQVTRRKHYEKTGNIATCAASTLIPQQLGHPYNNAPQRIK